MRIDSRSGQNDLHDRSLLITRTPSTNRRRSAVSTGCAASHSSLSIASSVPSNSAFAAKNETDAALLPRPTPSEYLPHIFLDLNQLPYSASSPSALTFIVYNL